VHGQIIGRNDFLQFDQAGFRINDPDDKKMLMKILPISYTHARTIDNTHFLLYLLPKAILVNDKVS
jgi:hypothetical protein